MPIYPINPCPCGHTDDVFARAADSGSLKCPACGKPVTQDYTRKNVGNGNREFHGHRRESITDWYHPTEVAEARRDLGAAGSCVQDNGTVVFPDRQTQKKYSRAKADIMRRAGRAPETLGTRPVKSVTSD